MTTTNTADDTFQIPQTGRYQIDIDRSTVTFKGRHLFGLAPVRGTFALRQGVIDVTDPVADSSVQVEIDTASFHTGNRQRDRDVRSARFLDTGRHPSMRFISELLDRSGRRPVLTGTLLVRDVARPVSLTIEQSTVHRGRPPSFTTRATARIDRTEFGLTAARGMAGRYFGVSLQILWVAR
jgi:polyisoprenoid-binding protein YceI